ncbi:MAG TPA: metabolite traffic protein EboE [Chitinophaga sp.]|uniref:metabolite traffic protein EboE n=1 Tax=Chitinophaga sp. TaxID=1869181 RepID=UPI002D19AD4A|nr:metabolite traffic protein EboE [Chitinophaga sp.]HVI48108.1 metabolite traffic protein EboE [Chitinophaga sp.]
MQTPYGHLTYCTNIHPGEKWDDHFAQLKKYIPAVRKEVAPGMPFGIGLRLSNTASLELSKEENLYDFKTWLKQEDCYVFTMNGFPYGSFHHIVVKDEVHAPDWTQADRVSYTIRLFRILSALLPDGMEGSISTSPLSYKYWSNRCEEDRNAAVESATLNMLLVVEHLARVHRSGGPLMHLDIEPEPDGVLENSQEYIDWFTQSLLPLGIPFISDKLRVDEITASNIIRQHVQLCYDVCHFALAFEEPQHVISSLKEHGLKVGKMQISAALMAYMPEPGEERSAIVNALRKFDEPTYLHQVIMRDKTGRLRQYPDLQPALEEMGDPSVALLRAHFHVPVFLQKFDPLYSTQDEIRAVLELNKREPFTTHFEVETYTWDVLPPDLKLEMSASIARELKWVKEVMAFSEAAI